MSSPTISEYPKRKLDLVPFNFQLEVIETALSTVSKTMAQKRYNNTNYQQGYYQYNQNHNQQNKYALAAVAAAAAVQHQQQQTFLLQQQILQQQQQLQQYQYQQNQQNQQNNQNNQNQRSQHNQQLQQNLNQQNLNQQYLNQQYLNYLPQYQPILHLQSQPGTQLMQQSPQHGNRPVQGVQQQVPLSSLAHQNQAYGSQDLSSSSSVLSETPIQYPPLSSGPRGSASSATSTLSMPQAIDFSNNFMMCDGSSHSLTSPNLSGPPSSSGHTQSLSVQQQLLQPALKQSTPLHSKLFDSIHDTNLMNSPILLPPNSNNSNKSSPPNLFLSTSGSNSLSGPSTGNSTLNQSLNSKPLSTNQSLLNNVLSGSNTANWSTSGNSTPTSSIWGHNSSLSNNSTINNFGSNSGNNHVLTGFGSSGVW